MKIVVTSVFVADQKKALKFYTDVMGFVKKTDIPDVRWLTVISPDQPNGPELLLEPNENPVAQDYQQGLVKQGIAAASFAVDDVKAEYERMKKLGVKFTMEPTQMGPVTIAVLDDTCGNLIQIAQQ
jgi:predicted enzyme related to lactoylglutathione lyase